MLLDIPLTISERVLVLASLPEVELPYRFLEDDVSAWPRADDLTQVLAEWVAEDEALWSLGLYTLVGEKARVVEAA